MKEITFKRIIIVLSVVLPLMVFMLFRIKIDGYNTNFLPPIYATTNAITAILLVAALFAVKRRKIELHERLIKICLGLSVLFIVLYAIRHMTATEVRYGDTNGDGFLSETELFNVRVTRYIYYFILISHIMLSVIVIPFVLFAFMRGMLNQIEKHKKIVRFAFPIWLYVAVSGALVYLMISPYYI
ncbi:MAG: DUF420 domain-containing protein [Bacteroidetes bacterium]|nr:DUF420 domain-containing protein [Bacteroidota bacterium]